MARLTKIGLDYFPLDTDMDEKIELIEAKHGLVGFAVIIKLYQAIYKRDGYFIDASEERLLLLSKRINVDINSLNAIINDSLRWKIFNSSVFDRFKVLTSAGIQNRYLEASKKRLKVTIIKEYLLVSDIQTLCPKCIIVDINSLNVDINSLNVDISTQTKLEETKEDIKKINKRKSPSKNIPDIFPVTQQMKTYAEKKNYTGDLENLTERFLIHHRSKGSKFSNWHSAWQNWLLNEIKWHGTGKAQPQDEPPSEPYAGMTLEDILS